MMRSPRAGAEAFRVLFSRRRPILRALALAVLVAAGCQRSDAGAPSLSALPPPADPDNPASWQPYYPAISALGEGFVVWESWRDGHWRIWMRPLDGSPERQLSPDEPGRDHVAAHIAPDGRHLVYLSLPAPHKRFNRLPPEVAAPLHLVTLDGDRVVSDRILVPSARTYQQSRAAVWVNPRELIYIANDRTTRQIDILTGAEQILVPHPTTKWGMLVNATHTHATNDQPTFSIYHPADGTISRRKKLAGCQPYFTPDGRFGYWMAGTGGPIRAYDLSDGTTTLMLDRGSRFLPKGDGYLYYPMVSADQRLLAFSASHNKHGHFTADFDVFVAPLDPETLAVTGTAVRYSFSPGQDRFPDVWVAGTELGRHRGEAPLRITLEPDPSAGPWTFDFGDGSPETADATHVFERPGDYRVTARAGGRRLGGEVRVDPAAPPRLVRVEVRPGGRQLAAVFDERIDPADAKVSLGSGAVVTGVARGERATELIATLAEPLAHADVLHVEGVRDRAGVPHVMEPTSVPVEMTAWPGRGEGLAFVYATEDAENTGPDLDTGHSRTFDVEAHGRGRFDAHGALEVSHGWFEAEELPQGFSAAFRDAGAVTVELTVWPEVKTPKAPGRILALAADPKRVNLTLTQDGNDVKVTLRTTSEEGKHEHWVQFGQLAVGEPNHLLVSYQPGHLVAYQNGHRVLDTDAIRGDLSDWRDDAGLSFGADPGGGDDFRGTLEGIALYSRFLEPDEAIAHANAYLHEVQARPAVPRLALRARLLAASTLPTVEQIAPYREALVVNEYEVPPRQRERVGGPRIRVAHWAILDARPQPVPGKGSGKSVALQIEPFDSHPRLESTYLSDSLDPDPDVPLFVDVSP
jgi:Concanavalin A-like lectin/glucanases superfamily/PKD domain